jgi:hypothetical protein
MMPDLTTDSGWHLDKRVPIAIVLAIFFQTAGIVWFAATLENRVAQLEASQAHRADERDRLIALETQMRAIHETLLRMERRLERDANQRR